MHFAKRSGLAAIGAVALWSAISLGGGTWAGGGPLLNGAFDTGVAHWAIGSSSALNTLSWTGNEDAGADPSSGAAVVRIGEGPYDPGMFWTEVVVQCVPAVAGTMYDGDAKVRAPTANQVATTKADLSLFFYANPNCAGGNIGNHYAGPVGVSNAWQSLAVDMMAPAGARSLYVRLEVDGEDEAGPTQSYAYFDDVRLLGELGSLPGDVNCDQEINSIDALLLLQLDANLLQSLPCLANSDANENGITNAIDATLVLQFGAGLIDQLPPA